MTQTMPLHCPVDSVTEGQEVSISVRPPGSWAGTRRCSWNVEHSGWVVTLHSPGDQTFSNQTPDEGLAWCLVWRMATQLGIGPFRV